MTNGNSEGFEVYHFFLKVFHVAEMIGPVILAFAAAVNRGLWG